MWADRIARFIAGRFPYRSPLAPVGLVAGQWSYEPDPRSSPIYQDHIDSQTSLVDEVLRTDPVICLRRGITHGTRLGVFLCTYEGFAFDAASGRWVECEAPRSDLLESQSTLGFFPLLTPEGQLIVAGRCHEPTLLDDVLEPWLARCCRSTIADLERQVDDGGERVHVYFDARGFDGILAAATASAPSQPPRRQGLAAPSDGLVIPVPDEGVLFWPDGHGMEREHLFFAHDHEQVVPQGLVRVRAGDPLLAVAPTERSALAIDSLEPVEVLVSPGQSVTPGTPLARGSRSTLVAERAGRVVRIEHHTKDEDTRGKTLAEAREEAMRLLVGELLLGRTLRYRICDDAGQTVLKKGDVVGSLDGLRRAWLVDLADACEAPDVERLLRRVADRDDLPCWWKMPPGVRHRARVLIENEGGAS